MPGPKTDTTVSLDKEKRNKETLMDIESFALNCQHPFGNGIHMVVPRNRAVLLLILEGVDLLVPFHTDYSNLKKKVTHNKAAAFCVKYQGTPPNQDMGDCYVIISLIINPDFEVEQKSVVLLIEPDSLIMGRAVAETMYLTMQEELKKGVHERNNRH